MTTQIARSYKFAFLLSEQELRRLVQAGQQHATKLGALPQYGLAVALRDGSRIEAETVDEVLNLENGGQKEITRLDLHWADEQEPPGAGLQISYCNTLGNQFLDSIELSVKGDSRDSVFVAAADLEERIKKTRNGISWHTLVDFPGILAFFVVVIFASAVLVVINPYALPRSSPADRLEEAYRAGEISDPVEAIIMAMRESEKMIPQPDLKIVSVAVLVAVVLLILMLVMPKLARPYVFYWGDAVALHDKRRNLIMMFWTVVVLGLVVSVVGGLIIRALP